VSVWTVPQPRALPATASPPLLRLPPCATVSAAQLGGSCPSAIDWLQVAPHDLLLVGCWDGQVALVKLSPGQATPGSGTHVLQRFPAETVPLRCVRFCPVDVGAPAADLPHRHTFMTAGHEGTLKIWDSR
jgi:general transcription factor 3C polypeptide 2